VTFVQLRVFIFALIFRGFVAQSVVDATTEENRSNRGGGGGGKFPPIIIPAHKSKI
jgi:hypothetical protein